MKNEYPQKQATKKIATVCHYYPAIIPILTKKM